jgi:hypothetical protein
VIVDHTMIELVRTERCMVLGAGVSAYWSSEGRVPCVPEVEVEVSVFKETEAKRGGGSGRR